MICGDHHLYIPHEHFGSVKLKHHKPHLRSISVADHDRIHVLGRLCGTNRRWIRMNFDAFTQKMLKTVTTLGVLLFDHTLDVLLGHSQAEYVFFFNRWLVCTMISIFFVCSNVFRLLYYFLQLERFTKNDRLNPNRGNRDLLIVKYGDGTTINFIA